MPRLTLAVILVFPAILFVPAARAACTAADPAGFFEGRAESRDAGRLEVSLNLRCADGRYEGELETPLGVLRVQSGSATDGRVQLTLGPDAAVTIDATFAGDTLHGSFRAGDDGGPVELKRTGAFRGAANTGVMTAPRWRADLRHFATELPKRHIEPFRFTPRETWMAEVAELDETLESMDDDAIYVALNRLANRIGDAHTYVEFPEDRASLPLRFRRFGDEYRVVSAVAGYERAVGARLVSIDELPVANAVEKLRPMAPIGETKMLADSRIEGFLSLGLLLHGSGITTRRDRAQFGLISDDGEPFTVVADAADVKPNVERRYAYAERPLWLQRGGEDFWFVWSPKSRMIYCQFNGYDNLREHARALFAAVEQHRPEKLVIDMRRNGGGDYTVGLEYLIEPIRETPSINQPNRLFVVIGPDTFSAAMSNAAHFRERTKALLVGETIGERPNSNQEPREFRLPHSNLVVRYSTRRYEFTKDPENLIRPDQEIKPTWEAYKAGRDPVLDWIERVPVGSGLQSTVSHSQCSVEEVPATRSGNRFLTSPTPHK